MINVIKQFGKVRFGDEGVAQDVNMVLYDEKDRIYNPEAFLESLECDLCAHFVRQIARHTHDFEIQKISFGLRVLPKTIELKIEIFVYHRHKLQMASSEKARVYTTTPTNREQVLSGFQIATESLYRAMREKGVYQDHDDERQLTPEEMRDGEELLKKIRRERKLLEQEMSM